MTHAQLIALPNHATEEEEEIPLRAQVDAILEEHHENLKTAIKKWILFRSDFGARTLHLDECPVVLSKHDREFVIEWLRDEGFSVRSPRFGRAIIDISPS